MQDIELGFINDFIRFLKQLNLYLNHFPRAEKYALAQRIRNKAYEVWDLMSELRKKHFKKTSAARLDIALEGLRLDLYLAKELKYFEFKDNKKSSKEPAALALHRFSVLEIFLSGLEKRVQEMKQRHLNEAI